MSILAPRDGWTMPAPPTPEHRPYFYVIGVHDGVDLFFATKTEIATDWPEGDEHRISWPFADDAIACAADFARLGFYDAEFGPDGRGADWIERLDDTEATHD